MNIKNILETYNEYKTFYYMNNQNLIDNDYDRQVAEEITTKMTQDEIDLDDFLEEEFWKN